jgi:hypothetical protein
MATSASPGWAADTSFAVAAVDESHEGHVACRDAAIARRPALAGHAAFEVYAVLTRLPGAARVSPTIAAEVLARAFPSRCWLTPRQQDRLLRSLPHLGISGGMAYDALVGEAARIAGRVLLTRDVRARRTYAALGVEFEVIG